MHGTEQRDSCRGQHQERPRDELTPLNRRDRLGHGLAERRAVEDRGQVIERASVGVAQPGKPVDEALVEPPDQFEGFVDAWG